MSEIARHQDLHHGEEDCPISQGAHSLVESETTLSRTTQRQECSAERGNTGDSDDGGIGSGLKEPLVGYLNLKLCPGGRSKMEGEADPELTTSTDTQRVCTYL